MLTKVSDYIANTLVRYDIHHVFMITGGGAMHLNNSIGKHPQIDFFCNHHEQASAMAAESYARLTNKIAAVCVTSGPGGTNAITGVLGAWLDSIPMLVISGQVRYDTTVRSTNLNLRQLGDQEFDIVKSVIPMTKYAVMVTDPTTIRYHLERAIHLAYSGRPGPCWLDIPLNVQGALIDETTVKSYDPNEDYNEIAPILNDDTISEIIDRIVCAKRPVLLAGSGIRLSGAHPLFLKLVDLLNIPIVTAWNAHDCITSDHRLYYGRPGTVGDRAGNFIVQNSDLLLVLGCRLNIRQIGYSWETFAREAFKIVVDIDPLELNKPTIRPDLPICANVIDVIKSLTDKLSNQSLPPKQDWLNWCLIRKKSYPVVLKEYWLLKDYINPYCFFDTLSKHLPEGQIIVAGNGTAAVCLFQTAYIKINQRLYSNSGCAAMGYDLPAAIGACIASNKSKVVCIAGDGSIQMNLQELQTVVHYHLPIKIFVLNNYGYHSIRQTQENYFGHPLVGADPSSGVTLPDMKRIADAYQIPFIRCSNHDEMRNCIEMVLDNDDPYICEVMLTCDRPFAPKAASRRLADGSMASRPLEDLAPLLDRKELEENMIIDLL